MKVLVTISLTNPSQAIRGWLRNAFLEPQPCLFVGTISARQLVQLIEQLEASQCAGTVIVHKKGRHGGARMKNLGCNRLRTVVNFDGVQLVQRL